jgi:shikimate dehydrogenase
LEINKDTVLCISVASRPSNFGTTVHNAAYRALGLNFLYKAFGTSDIKGTISGVRALGIRGCSVSMPFKESIVKELDTLDEAAKAIGAVNTVVNDGGRLTGYNTDAHGAEVALKITKVVSGDSVLLLGAGGVAKAIFYALRRVGVKRVLVANRTAVKAKEMAGADAEVVAWESRHEAKADVLINATSIGMSPDSERVPFELKKSQGCRTVLDVVVSPMESLLIRTARSLGLETVPGYKMSLHQAAAQFRLYTSAEPPLKVMEDSIVQLLQASR